MTTSSRVARFTDQGVRSVRDDTRGAFIRDEIQAILRRQP